METANFVPASDRAHTAVSFLYVSMAMELLTSGSTAVQLLSHSSADPGPAQIAMWSLYLVATVACGVFFLRWMHRAYANLHALGATRLRFSPGWAVGSFFVPIVCLFHPLQAMREIWHHSSRSPASVMRDTYSYAVPLLGMWWATYLVSNFFGNASFRMSFGEPTAEVAQTAAWLGILSGIVRVPAALLLIEIIRKVDRFQCATRDAQQVAAS